MCEIMERKVKERWNEEKMRLAKKAITKNEYSLDKISDLYDLPLSTVEEIAASMQKKKKNRV